MDYSHLEKALMVLFVFCDIYIDLQKIVAHIMPVLYFTNEMRLAIILVESHFIKKQ